MHIDKIFYRTTHENEYLHKGPVNNFNDYNRPDDLNSKKRAEFVESYAKDGFKTYEDIKKHQIGRLKKVR